MEYPVSGLSSGRTDICHYIYSLNPFLSQRPEISPVLVGHQIHRRCWKRELLASVRAPAFRLSRSGLTPHALCPRTLMQNGARMEADPFWILLILRGVIGPAGQ